MSNLYKVAIVGRINVGKSTLFNKLANSKKAITSTVAGTTRDRNYTLCSWKDLDFDLIDTGGLEKTTGDDIDQQISHQAKLAIDEADLVLMVIDTKTGLMPADIELAKQFKKAKKPLLLIANKADNNKLRQSIAEFYKLNLGKPWPVSAASGVGTGDLLDEIVKRLKKIPKKKVKTSVDEDIPVIRVAIVGKPNVGKSSLINAILGEERVIVSSTPHTTRDSQDIEFNFEGQKIILIDTAGMRRQSRRSKDAFEKQSVEQSLLSIKKSDLIVLVTDVSKRLSWQDKHLIEEANEVGTGI